MTQLSVAEAKPWIWGATDLVFILDLGETISRASTAMDESAREWLSFLLAWDGQPTFWLPETGNKAYLIVKSDRKEVTT